MFCWWTRGLTTVSDFQGLKKTPVLSVVLNVCQCQRIGYELIDTIMGECLNLDPNNRLSPKLYSHNVMLLVRAVVRLKKFKKKDERKNSVLKLMQKDSLAHICLYWHLNSNFYHEGTKVKCSHGPFWCHILYL